MNLKHYLILQTFLGLINISYCFANIASLTGFEKSPINSNSLFAIKKLNSINPPSFLNKLTFSWAKNLMELGNRRKIEVDDVLQLSENENMTLTSELFESFYNKEIEIFSAKNNSKVIKRSLSAFLNAPISRAIAKMYILLSIALIILIF